MNRSFLIVLFALFLTPGLAFSEFQFGGSIKGSRHNLFYGIDGVADFLEFGKLHAGGQYNDYGEVCVYCHTPHNPNPEINAPLWNRPKPSAAFSLYSSSTLDSKPGQPAGVSLACLSCHDGTIAMDAILNKGGNWDRSESAVHRRMSFDITFDSCGECHAPAFYNNQKYPAVIGDHSGKYIGTDLSNDHPIGINYQQAYEAQSPSEFRPPENIAPLKLFDGKVECPTCHDVHTPSDVYTSIVFVTVKRPRSNHLRRRNRSSALCLTCHIK